MFDGVKLLLVDDNHINLMIAEEFLSHYGFTITTETGGRRAITAAQSGDFDIIFMDCQMPELDGYEATGILRHLMDENRIRRVPIVALTANALKGDREKCLEAGMDEFLPKPLDMQSLNDVFARIADLKEFDASEITRKAHAKRNHMAKVLNDPANRFEAPAGQWHPKNPSVMARNPDKPVLRAVPAPKAPVSPVTAAPAEEAASIAAAQAAPVAVPKIVPKEAPNVNTNAPGNATGNATSDAAPQAKADQKKLPLMDLREFEKTRSAMKNFDALISIYRTDTAQYLEGLAQALLGGDIEGAVLPAHTIKSSSRMVGASGLSALSASLETKLRTGQFGSVEELVAIREQMDRVFEATMKQIEFLLAQPPAQVSA